MNYQERKIKTPWILHYRWSKSRITNPNHISYKYYKHIKFLMSEKDFKDLWFRDKAYKMKKPSIDRIDNDGNYEFNNCRFIENKENSVKDKRISVLQFDLSGKFMKKFPSLREASRYVGVAHQHIGRAMKGVYKQSGGFIWKKEI